MLHPADQGGQGGETPSQGKRKREPKFPRPSIRTKPVRGVQLLPVRPQREKKFGVQWSIKGKRQTEWFSSLEKLEAKVVELNSARRHGTLTDVPTPNELREWRVFKEAAGGVSPLDVLDGWKRWRESEGRPICDLLVSNAVDFFLEKQERRLERETIKKNTFRQKRAKLKRFKEAFAISRLDEITTRMLEDWLDGLDDVQKSDTQKDYLKHVCSLYNFFKQPSPTEEAEILPPDSEPTLPMSVQDAAKLLRYTLGVHPEFLVRLACEMFLGLRTSSAARIREEHLSRKERLVHITRDIIKTNSTHNVAPPANLWAWVERGWDLFTTTPISESKWMHAKSKLLNGAEVPHPRNVLRHTFCSYHLSAFQNPGATAWLLMHTDQELLWQTYRETATPKDGQAYFRLLPQNVARVAAFGHLPAAGRSASTR